MNTSLRERKKRQTREEILKVSNELFYEKGFENVKVAEIADKSNISVKTLFTYFDSKEDLIFNDEDKLLNDIKNVILNRKKDESIFEAFKVFIKKEVKENNVENSFNDIGKLIDIVENTPVLNNRLLKMWNHYEKELSEVLLDENITPINADIIAANLVLPLRTLFSNKAQNLISKYNADWVDNIFNIIGNGISKY